MRSRRVSECALAILLLSAACRSYTPAPLALRVTSEPPDAAAELTCPTTPDFGVQRGVTPKTFRVPQWAGPCTLILSKEGWRTEERVLNRQDLLVRNHGAVEQERPPIRFQQGAGPLSVMFALLARWVNDVGDAASERLSTAIHPDAAVHVVLRPNVAEHATNTADPSRR